MTWLLVSAQCPSTKTDIKLCEFHFLWSKWEKIAPGVLVLSCVPISSSDNLLYDFFVKKKKLKTLYSYIFCTISGSKITTEHFSVSCVIVHSLSPEILVQYFLFITTAIIYNCISYSMSSVSLSLLMTLSVLLSLKFSSELHTISSTSLSVKSVFVIAMPSESLLSQQLNEVHWLKTWRVNTSNYRTYVDSYTRWKAELFSAYLPKEMFHDICVDFKLAAEMMSMQRPSRRWGKYFKLPNAV